MEIKIEQQEGVTVAAVEGSIDAMTSATLAEAFDAQIAAGNVKLVAELSKVSYTSSAGLRVLLGATKDSRSNGGDLRLAGVQPNVLKVLELSGFTSILKVLDSLEEAVNSYSG
jgi:anti-anti-sigma factor